MSTIIYKIVPCSSDIVKTRDHHANHIDLSRKNDRIRKLYTRILDLQNMKGCFLLQRRFAYLAHEIAKGLKEEYGMTEFCGTAIYMIGVIDSKRTFPG